MKFITSTHLKTWAATKDCQQLLPELVKKLIEASVADADHLSFPSGDAVSLPGWDGVVSCGTGADFVPEGISLWECGTTEDVKGKIDSDFAKRDKNSLGYGKESSTFVFVTPRIWTGAEEWVNNHQTEWKKIVVYTAIELERWIEQRPSVGMWLAEKLRILPAGGYILPEEYWEKWAQGEKVNLPYQIILPGREKISQRIIEACLKPSLLVLKALSQNECIAFAIASILTSEKSHVLNSRMIVVTDKSAFDDLVNHYDNLIILTTLTEDLQYTVRRGHSVIVASTPADQLNGCVALPIIEKEGFVGALVNAGVNEIEARRISMDTTRDVNVLRRIFGVIIDKPKWAERDVLGDLLPAFLVGKWNSNLKGDREILEVLSGMNYEQYEAKLQIHVFEENSPFIHIGSIWRVRSPYEVMQYARGFLTDPMMEKYRQVCLNLIQDDDSNAVEEFECEKFKFWNFNQKYSSVIKKGSFQNLILLSLGKCSDKISRWVEHTLKEMLNDWDLTRFLSNRHYLEILAEASPEAFLSLMEGLPECMVEKIFTPRKKELSLNTEIYYADVLFALEMLAWNAEYLNRVTRLLLRYSAYKNESNYSNKPINSLCSIYRLYAPQTFVSFADRMALLKACSSDYKETLFQLCVMICESRRMGWFTHNSYYRWRMYGNSDSNTSGALKKSDVEAVVRLMLECCEPTAENLSKILELSFNHNIGKCDNLIITFVKEHLTDMTDRQLVVDSLRKEINQYMLYPNSCRFSSNDEVNVYMDLLDNIEPKDALHKNLWLFENTYVQLPHKQFEKFNYELNSRELLQERIKVVQKIIEEQGTDGVWELVNAAKCPESTSESIVSVLNDSLNDDVCRMYKSKEICDRFVESYFSALFNKDNDAYKELAKRTIEMNADLVVVLYAPRYKRELAEIANTMGPEIKNKYWNSVDVRFIKVENAADVVRELVNVNRYSDAIGVINHNKESIQMSDVEIVRIILGLIVNGSTPLSHLEVHWIKELLDDLDEVETPEVINKLVEVEFYLYKALENQKDMGKSRFAKELTSDPNLMIQLVEFAYRADDGSVEQVNGIPLENRKIMADLAWHVLHYGCSLTPGMNQDGSLDESVLSNYIERLYELARQKKRIRATDVAVGFMLGDVPCDEKYPIDILGRIIEKLNNDVVDEYIETRILNSRGVVTRAYNEGGSQERALAAKYDIIKKHAQLLYPRMAKIFNDLNKGYSAEASREDDNAYMVDLDS